MTIAELVAKHGLPVRVHVASDRTIRPFTVHTEKRSYWLVDYDDGPTGQFISRPSLSDYELEGKEPEDGTT